MAGRLVNMEHRNTERADDEGYHTSRRVLCRVAQSNVRECLNFKSCQSTIYDVPVGVSGFMAHRIMRYSEGYPAYGLLLRSFVRNNKDRGGK